MSISTHLAMLFATQIIIKLDCRTKGIGLSTALKNVKPDVPARLDQENS